MGLVHDFAYEFVSDQREHEHAGGEILKRVGFVYAGAAMRTAFLLGVGIWDDHAAADKKEK